MTATNSATTLTPAPLFLLEGQQGVIERFTNEYFASKLMSMGIMPGATLRMVRRAPMGGGWYVRIDRQNLALRTDELASIVMKQP